MHATHLFARPVCGLAPSGAGSGGGGGKYRYIYR